LDFIEGEKVVSVEKGCKIITVKTEAGKSYSSMALACGYWQQQAQIGCC